MAYGETRALARSVAIVLAATVVVIGLGAGLSALLPQLKVSMTTARSPRASRRRLSTSSPRPPPAWPERSPSLVGTSGRRDVGDILPGVAIAISLVPPLAVVGVTAAGGDLDGALGALLLYLTNVLAIIVVGIVLSALSVSRRASFATPPSGRGGCSVWCPRGRASSWSR
jgi:hypothetical protein